MYHDRGFSSSSAGRRTDRRKRSADSCWPGNLRAACSPRGERHVRPADVRRIAQLPGVGSYGPSERRRPRGSRCGGSPAAMVRYDQNGSSQPYANVIGTNDSSKLQHASRRARSAPSEDGILRPPNRASMMAGSRQSNGLKVRAPAQGQRLRRRQRITFGIIETSIVRAYSRATAPEGIS